MPNRIARCDCYSPYQDEKYGDGMRLHTEGDKQITCTICEKKKPKP
jgi:hypothetical protein